jgi:hypothetical protein
MSAFNPKKSPVLDNVYVSIAAKEWIKQQAITHDVTMVSVVDEMVSVCKQLKGNERPNVLREGL